MAPTMTRKRTCGICESVKTMISDVLVCPHCDTIACSSPCPICKSGYKNLPDRPANHKQQMRGTFYKKGYGDGPSA